MEQNLQAELLGRLQPQTVFSIPVLGGIPVTETVIVTWIIMAILTVSSILLVRNFTLIPSGVQNMIEIIVESINNFVKGIIGHEWKTFAPYIGTVALYLSLSDTISIFGIEPPTKDLNVTLALSVMTMAVVVTAGIRLKGLGKWLKGFKDPIILILPMNILELFIRPLSLSMRLFGNILGSFIIMELIYHVIPIGLPAILSLYFDIFDGLIQMIVFIFLSTLFIKEAIENA